MKANSKKLLTKSYHIPLSVFDKAFRCFQKKYVYPRNIVLTVILGGIFLVYLSSMLKEPKNSIVYLLLVVCLAMIMIIWYNPMKLRRSLMESLKELENDTYHFTLYQDGVKIGMEDAPKTDHAAEEAQAPEVDVTETEATEPKEADADGFLPIFDEEDQEAQKQASIPATEIPFGTGLKIHEYDEFFMLYLVKNNFYVVPKKDFSEEEIKLLRDTFPIE